MWTTLRFPKLARAKQFLITKKRRFKKILEVHKISDLAPENHPGEK